MVTDTVLYYANDLGLQITSCKLGLKGGDLTVRILLYADDVIFVAEHENVLQKMRLNVSGSED